MQGWWLELGHGGRYQRVGLQYLLRSPQLALTAVRLAALLSARLLHKALHQVGGCDGAAPQIL